MAFKKFERVDLPTPEPSTHPDSVGVTRRRDGVLFVAGEGVKPARVMFVQTSLQEEEAMETQQTGYGAGIRDRARYLKGPAGMLVKDCAASCGLDFNEHYFTALIKWLVPKAQRKKPKKEHIQMAKDAFYSEIREVKPEIIVCFGKVTFDLLINLKVAADDLQGGWFFNEEFKVRVYLMPDIMMPLFKPEYLERFAVDFSAVRKMLDTADGNVTDVIKTDMRVIRTLAEVDETVREWEAEDVALLSPDCEWQGNNHVDGKLRSIQFAWWRKDGTLCARFIAFRNERGEYVMDAAYAVVGAILGRHLNRTHIRYTGHHLSADFVWMLTWLGLQVYRRALVDTEFAMQVVDETAPLGLEQLALRYTPFGRYDLELMLWLKANKQPPMAGFGSVPDRLLEPYGMYDVMTPLLASKQLIARMLRDNTFTYYMTIFGPFVTDVFTEFSLNGLPVNRGRMDELRDLYHFAREEMTKEFQQKIAVQARELFVKFCAERSPQAMLIALRGMDAAAASGDWMSLLEPLKPHIGLSNIPRLIKFLEHLQISKEFNIQSSAAKARWLFDVCGHVPIKSTANKAKGIPAVDWQRVLEYEPHVQKEFTPAVDKQTLQILAELDPMVQELQKLNAVATVCKSFLKEAQYDDEGNLLLEQGLHFWISSDERIHGQCSTTETGRPRSWKPNTLNWASYVNKLIKDGMKALFERLGDKLPERFRKYLKEDIPSIRALVDAASLPPLPGSKGWCMVESDYKTAEIRGLGFISGDENLIRLMTEPDHHFGMVVHDGKQHSVRIKYSDQSETPAHARKPEFLMALWIKGKFIRAVDVAELVRNDDGTLYHPAYDLHWSLAEMVKEAVREVLDDKIDRGGLGKTGNFSTAYGAVAATLERKIKAETGKEPEPGIGQKILDALRARQPVAVQFLEDLQEAPKNYPYWQAESGRKRHFNGYGSHSGAVGRWQKKKMFSELGRQARNYPFQESVASTSARAGLWLIEDYRQKDMHAKLMTILYDSCVTFCPVEERFAVAAMHEEYMDKRNVWHNHGRTWSYPIDTEFVLSWSYKPSKDMLAKLNDTSWAADPSVLPKPEKLGLISQALG